ncbi:MAG TPA: Rv0909 family putative TA system antitoxin [Acidimicrobiales bacterium]|nr:Rv0909 family putative TA system antitoxin [Acidimicrobiales bacterium]
MVNLGKLAKKAKDIADKQGDKISGAVDKATDLVDKKTKGKYKDKLDKVDGLASKLDKTKKPGTAEQADDPPAG